MGKRGRGKPSFSAPPKGGKKGGEKTKEEFVEEKDMDDEIDAFHKQRDFVPMDVNGDAEDSDSDDVVPVFDNKDLNEEDDDDDGDEDDHYDPGLAAKIARQQRFLRQRIGGVEDDMHDDDEDEDGKRIGWGRNKNIYYSADNVDYEIQSDDEELPEEEERAVLELQKERAKQLTMEDFGLEDSDEDDSDLEPTLEERSKNKDVKSKRDPGGAVDMTLEAPRDLSSLPPEEQMDAVNSAAPELVGLLSELNDARLELENDVNPLLKKVKLNESATKGGMHYLEVKQALLLSYCQAITLYLLLKSEGQSTHDHPVMDRIAQIRGLLDKIKELDANLPSDCKDLIQNEPDTTAESPRADVVPAEDVSTSQELDETEEPATVTETAASGKMEVVKESLTKGRKEKRPDEARLGHQSKEMLKFRASLEDKLRQKGVLSSAKSNPDKQPSQKAANRQLQTLDDFDDDPVDDRGRSIFGNGTAKPLQPKRLSELVTSARANKPKVMSGEDDLVDRGDIGERRRQHELRVLKKAGIESEDGPGDEPSNEDDDMDGGDESEESEDEFYQQVKRQKLEKLAAKQPPLSSGTVEKRSVPDETVDGKRLISYQMEKNRGLTRARKKAAKNPRKKYRDNHEKKVKARKGQVRDIRKPTCPYGGETTGINARISRSIRLKA
uniref:Sas10 C-terminal domain-containing protein n=1 Tax=Kalanchoe fedtschenkoi TaxID=63787 RepID=A0A7N0UL01_KALFE